MDNIIKKNNSIEFDKNKCIKCTKCVQKCNNIGICHLSIKGEEKRYIDFNKENPCINCGQCTLVCPVNSMREQSNVDDVKKILEDKEKIIIAQCAPSVRTSINEIFKIEHSVNIEKKINTCLKLLGFNKVFDVNFGADITSIIEANELMERIKNNENLPMFTSCCPAWVKFVKTYKPELIDHLTTAMSPHIHSGMAYKTWWAEKEKIDPKNIIVVSIMPCTAKKDEIYIYNNIKAVDYVLTVREFGKLIKEKNIDFQTLKESEADSLSEYSGGAVIYGKSSGVMESALRVIKKKFENKKFDKLILNTIEENNTIIKEAKINIDNKELKIAVISSPKNIKSFLESEKYKEYHYVEFMNCKGGCINGGGQPLLPLKPNSEDDLIEKRKLILEKLDVNKQNKLNALDNKTLNEYLNWAKNKDFKKQLFYTNFK